MVHPRIPLPAYVWLGWATEPFYTSLEGIHIVFALGRLALWQPMNVVIHLLVHVGVEQHLACGYATFSGTLPQLF